mmetsp:Transcript_1639/g.5046  ORF Transcript_1639/g.5046 Transcript_1639/m.5046 type:complete len:455 (+) Transcript_1639:799-2163(+)
MSCAATWSQECLFLPSSPQRVPCRTWSFSSRMSLCTGAMSPRTSCFARKSSSSCGSQTEPPEPQDCRAATSRSMDALPSCLTSTMLKTSPTRIPVLPSGTQVVSSRPRSFRALPKASMSMSLKRSSRLANASLTCLYLEQHMARRSSSTQEGANCLMPFTNSITERSPLWSRSMSRKRSLISCSLKSRGWSMSVTLVRVSWGSESKSSVVLSSKAFAKAPLICLKRWRTFSLRSSSRWEGSERPMAPKNSMRVTSPELSKSISRKAFLASLSVKPRLRTAFSVNSWRLIRPQRFMSKSKKAFSKFPLYFLSSLSRTSSSSSAGETVATALASSPMEVVPSGSLQTRPKRAICSPWSATWTLLRSLLKSSNCSLCEVVVPLSSSRRMTCVMDVKPEASHLLRRSSRDRTGAEASTAMTNSFTVTTPRPRKSRWSKMWSLSFRFSSRASSLAGSWW